MKKTLSYTSAFGIGFVVCAFALKAMYGIEPRPPSSGQGKVAVLAALNATPTLVAGQPSPVALAAAKVEPAVVDVHTIGKAIENPFNMFFGMQGQDQPEEHPHGAGSGIIISPDGYILTNNHVVADTEKVEVTFDDKRYTAKVVGTDPQTDIAVCKIDTGGLQLPVAELGDSDAIKIGDWAIAVGNPLDIGTTVTLGIISAKNRTGLHADGGQSLNSVIQTDAAINPGNSGGALANINGQVIGVNEAIYSPTGSYVGIGFAIPINAAKKIAAQLIESGHIVRPYLGVGFESLKEISQEARDQIGVTVTGDDGAIVTQVYPGSPAEEAGLQQYDVVLKANKETITDDNSLYTIIQKLKVGDTLVLLVSRNGQQQIISVKLKERPATFGQQSQRPQPQQMMPQGPQGPQGPQTFTFPFGSP